MKNISFIMNKKLEINIKSEFCKSEKYVVGKLTKSHVDVLFQVQAPLHKFIHPIIIKIREGGI